MENFLSFEEQVVKLCGLLNDMIKDVNNIVTYMRFDPVITLHVNESCITEISPDFIVGFNTKRYDLTNKDEFNSFVNEFVDTFKFRALSTKKFPINKLLSFENQIRNLVKLLSEHTGFQMEVNEGMYELGKNPDYFIVSVDGNPIFSVVDGFEVHHNGICYELDDPNQFERFINLWGLTV